MYELRYKQCSIQPFVHKTLGGWAINDITILSIRRGELVVQKIGSPATTFSTEEEARIAGFLSGKQWIDANL
jgi:hypothetical protein